MASNELGEDDAGRGQADADAAGGVGVSDAVGEGLDVVRSPDGLFRSDDELGVGDAVAVGWRATFGVCRDDQSAKAVTDPATRATVTTAMITTSRREGILTPVETRI